MEGNTRPICTNLIQRMPVELQLNVFRYLDYPAAIRLSQTNQHFHNFIDPQTWPDEEKHWFAQEAETFNHNIDRQNTTFLRSTWVPPKLGGAIDTIRTEKLSFYCRRCFTVKPAQKPRESQIRASLFIGHMRDGFQRDRVTCSCLDCDIALKAFRHGIDFRILVRLSAGLHLHFKNTVTYGADHSEDAIDYIQISSMRQLEAKLMRFCGVCDELHSAEDWESLDCSSKALSKAHNTKIASH